MNQNRPADIALKRMRAVIEAERNGLLGADLEQLKRDIAAVLCEYFVMPKGAVSVSIENRPMGEGKVQKLLTLTADIGATRRIGVKL